MGIRLSACTTRTGLISDSRRTRQQVGPQRSALGLSARFSPFQDSVACTIVMRWQLRLKSYFSEDQTLFLEPGRGTVHVFCEHLSPGDDSACNPKPTSSRQVETNPLNARRNDLANYNLGRGIAHSADEQAVGERKTRPTFGRAQLPLRRMGPTSGSSQHTAAFRAFPFALVRHG